MNDKLLIDDLKQGGENDIIEFLLIIDLDVIAKILAGFLNTKGGSIIIGLDDKGKVVGIGDNPNEVRLLYDHLLTSIVPEAPIDIQELDYNGKKLILCKVLEGTKQPYIFDGTIYYRQHDKITKANSQQVSALIHRRQEDETHWERQVHMVIKYEDLDHSLITNIFEQAKSNNRISSLNSDLGVLLTKYGLLSNMYVTNAGGILFAQDGAKFYRQAFIRLTEYAGDKISDTLIRDDLIEGNLYALTDKLESYVQNLGTKSIIYNDTWERSDFTFPPIALREGFLNAIVHRDYSTNNSHMTVSVFSDKIVIANSGSLPPQLGGKKALEREHRSYPNNPDIAHMFFISGYIEKLGRGTHKIIDECKNADLKSPTWDNTGSEVVLTIYGPQVKKKGKFDAPNITFDALSTLKNDALIDAVNDVLIDSVSTKVRSRCHDIVRLIYMNDTLALKDLTSTLSVSRATIQRQLLDLIKLKLIAPIGPDKTRKYALNDALKKKIDALI